MNIEFEQFQSALIEQLEQMQSLQSDAKFAGIEMAGKLTHVLENPSTNIEANLISKELAVLKQLAIYAKDITKLSPLRRLLANYIIQVSTQLNWYQKSEASDSAFNLGHANAQLIGPQGLHLSDEIIVGVSLMAPDLVYPDHHHPPEEIYIVLSEGKWWQAGGDWWSPTTDGYVYNPANIMHAMSSTHKPLLAIWCLNL